MKSKKEILQESIIPRAKEILNKQEFSEEEKQSTLEFFLYMMSLSVEERKLISKDKRYLIAAEEFKKDKTKSHLMINTCNSIISEALDEKTRTKDS